MNITYLKDTLSYKIHNPDNYMMTSRLRIAFATEESVKEIDDPLEIILLMK
jgi:hypothetical protein